MHLQSVSFLLPFLLIGSIQAKVGSSRKEFACKLTSYRQQIDENVCEIHLATSNSRDDTIHFYNNGQRLHRKTNLIFKNSSLHYLPPILFHCMPYLENLRMESTNVKEILKGTFEEASNLLTLDLSGNLIEYLPKRAFHGAKNVHRLNLGNNRIRKVDEKSFSGLINLQDLNLAGNSLQDIEPVYSQLSQLKGSLMLNNNSIAIIHDFTAIPHIKENEPFQMALNMNTFGIGHNPLLRNINVTGMIQDLFMDECGVDKVYINNGIQKIYASGNNISEILVSGCDRLEVLKLSNNSIGQFDVLGACSRLWLINLSGNTIVELVPEVMKQLWRVSHLDLSGNQIEQVQPGAFPDNSFLYTLNLAKNRLKTFNLESIKHLRFLQSVYLNDNQLFKLDGVAGIPRLKRLEFISLRNNEWDCDGLVSLVRKLGNISFDKNLTGVSKSPNVEGINCFEDPMIDVRF